MYQKVLYFVKYNNAFTIIFVLCFFSVGITFAASPEMRDGVYSSQESIVSVDNSFIVSADLDNFNFNLRISSVTEDEKNYYAIYSYQTMVIEDGFWQNKEIEKTLTVSREALDGKDLGLYIAEELGENINYELSYLKRVQKLEKEKGESQKVVTTEYSGLIGKLLDPEEKVIEGYNPVIPELIPEAPPTVELNPEEVIVSTPYVEPPVEIIEPEQPVQEPALPTPTDESGVGTPTENVGAEEMINEELVGEVVEKLLQNQENPPPAVEETVPVPETP
jgi:hypothetical protein